jgi:hypothetical protein
MLHRHRHIVIALLLFSYLLLGSVGYLEALTVLGFGTNPHHLTKQTDNPSSTFKAYWTQHKHIPSTVKIAVPSPAVFMPPEMPRVSMYGIALSQKAFNLPGDPSFSLHSSRAPPQI